MTPAQRAAALAEYKKYLDNNYPKKGKKRDEIERAIMVGMLAAGMAINNGRADPYLSLLLLGGRNLSTEPHYKETDNA